MDKLLRYDPEVDYGDCYYECDSPLAKMTPTKEGEYVRYEDMLKWAQFLLKKEKSARD